MIGLDTNVLARYYIDDDADAQAQRQRLAARRLIESGQPLMVCKSVVLELDNLLERNLDSALTETVSVEHPGVSRVLADAPDRRARQARLKARTGYSRATALARRLLIQSTLTWNSTTPIAPGPTEPTYRRLTGPVPPDV